VDLSQIAQRNKDIRGVSVSAFARGQAGFLVCARFLRSPAVLAPAPVSVLANNSHSKRDRVGSLEIGSIISFCIGGVSVRKGF